MTSEINDIRTPAELKGFSFSKYKKTEVKQQFIDSMIKGKIEPACHWCAELVCAAHYEDVWESIFYFVGKHIHTGNPKIAVYLDKRYTVFRNIMNQGHYTSVLQLRNNPTIRQLFAEVITVITMSNKKPSFEPVRINRTEEFDMTQMTYRMKATQNNFAEPVMHSEDPKELIIAMNELAFNVGGPNPNMLQACYWIEWIIEFDVICKKRKEPCLCKRRSIDVENKYQRDIIWIVWDVLVFYADAKNPFVNSVISSLRNLFASRYTTGACRRRKYLMYFAVEMITETVRTDIELMTQSCKDMLPIIISKIDHLYKQIKKNEESPNTEYLFNNLEQQNTMEKTLQKMNMMNAMDFVSKQEDAA